MQERSEWLKIQYRVRFLTPFHFGSGVRNGLIDQSTNRQRSASSDNGLLYIPASTLKGVIRDRCEQIAEMAGFPRRGPDEATAMPELDIPHPIDRLFGTPRRPGTLWFNDGRLSDEYQQLLTDALARAAPPVGWQSFHRTRVALSHSRRTVLTGRLFNVEMGLPGMTFNSSIVGQVWGVPIPGAEELATCSTLVLVAGLLTIERLGGHKSSGSGSCEVDITSLRINGTEISPTDLLQHLEALSAVAEGRKMTE